MSLPNPSDQNDEETDKAVNRAQAGSVSRPTEDEQRTQTVASGEELPESFSSLPASEEDERAENDEWETVEVIEPATGDGTNAGGAAPRVTKVRRRKRQARLDAAELRLQGRRALCKRIEDIAPAMLKTVKNRILTTYLDSKRGLVGKEDDDLTKVILDEAVKLADRKRLLDAINSADQDVNRRDLKAIIFTVLLQEETYSILEQKLEEKVIEFEKALVKRSKAFDLNELKKSDPDRWHHLDTYRIVLDAAWSNDGIISSDESRLLGVLRGHLKIVPEEHWLLSAMLKRFPKEKCALHTADEVNDARKELQRQGLVWNYKNDDDQNLDVIPAEIAEVLRQEFAGQELQTVNFRRLISHDNILLTDLRTVLVNYGLDKSGNKADVIERVVASGIKPSVVLDSLDKEKLSVICGSFGLKTSGAKSELVARIISFYDDLTFEVRDPPKGDVRAEWYSNYELLASRGYAELHAKKLITRDLNIAHMFEAATAFLFESRLHVPCDMTRKDNRADGRLMLGNNRCLLLDCKSVEQAVNLQDHLEGQFDGYLRKEQENGKEPLGFLVIGPSFTPQSVKLAHQYKAKTNWDIALVRAEGLRHLAERWHATQPDKPFPIQLLNRTEVIDKERAEFLLSLA